MYFMQYCKALTTNADAYINYPLVVLHDKKVCKMMLHGRTAVAGMQ